MSKAKSKSYHKQVTSIRDKRAKRRDERNKLFYQRCEKQVEKSREHKEEVRKKRARAVKWQKDTEQEVELVSSLHKLEDQLAAFKKNGFKQEDIDSFKTKLDDSWHRNAYQISNKQHYHAGNIERYVLHFCAYLDAFELYEACLNAHIYGRFTHDSMDTVHFIGHKDFMDKAKAKGWNTSGWRAVSDNSFGFASDNISLLASRMDHDRPKILHIFPDDSRAVYRLRPLSQLVNVTT